MTVHPWQGDPKKIFFGNLRFRIWWTSGKLAHDPLVWLQNGSGCVSRFGSAKSCSWYSLEFYCWYVSGLCTGQMKWQTKVANCIVKYIFSEQTLSEKIKQIWVKMQRNTMVNQWQSFAFGQYFHRRCLLEFSAEKYISKRDSGFLFVISFVRCTDL